jgi:hypothetical protein
MRRIRSILSAGVVVAASCLVVGSASSAPAPHFGATTRRALTSIAVSGMGAGAIPGLAVGVWLPGEGSFAHAFGFLGHDGAIFGYGSTMLYLPSRHATIIVLGNNNDNGSPKPLIMAVAIAGLPFPGHLPHGLAAR